MIYKFLVKKTERRRHGTSVIFTSGFYGRSLILICLGLWNEFKSSDTKSLKI